MCVDRYIRPLTWADSFPSFVVVCVVCSRSALARRMLTGLDTREGQKDFGVEGAEVGGDGSWLIWITSPVYVCTLRVVRVLRISGFL